MPLGTLYNFIDQLLLCDHVTPGTTSWIRQNTGSPITFNGVTISSGSTIIYEDTSLPGGDFYLSYTYPRLGYSGYFISNISPYIPQFQTDSWPTGALFANNEVYYGSNEGFGNSFKDNAYIILHNPTLSPIIAIPVVNGVDVSSVFQGGSGHPQSDGSWIIGSHTLHAGNTLLTDDGQGQFTVTMANNIYYQYWIPPTKAVKIPYHIPQTTTNPIPSIPNTHITKFNQGRIFTDNFLL